MKNKQISKTLTWLLASAIAWLAMAWPLTGLWAENLEPETVLAVPLPAVAELVGSQESQAEGFGYAVGDTDFAIAIQEIRIKAMAQRMDQGELSAQSIGIVAAPQASLPSGTYWFKREIGLITETEGASIYYTLDGADPITYGTLYDQPIWIGQDTILKAAAVKDGEYSPEAIYEYQIRKISLGITPVVEEGFEPYTPTFGGQHLPLLGEGWSLEIRIAKVKVGDNLDYRDPANWETSWQLGDAVAVNEEEITATVPSGIPVGTYALIIKFVEDGTGNWASTSRREGFKVVKIPHLLAITTSNPVGQTFFPGDEVGFTAQGLNLRGIWLGLENSSKPPYQQRWINLAPDPQDATVFRGSMNLWPGIATGRWRVARVEGELDNGI